MQRQDLFLGIAGATAVGAFGFVFGGWAAGLLGLVAVACGIALAERARAAPGGSEARALAAAVEATTAFAPGAAVVFLAFNGGGFFPAAPAFVAVVLLLLIALQARFAPRPFAGLSRPLVGAAAALAVFAVWALVSGARSDAPFRALAEFDRALAYALALVAFALGGWSLGRLRVMTTGVALAAFVVCACGLATRLIPDVWHTTPNVFADQRLAYPLTYWNALAMLAVVGIVFTLHLTTTTRSAPWMRSAAAGALPLLAVTLLFTFSRGGIAAGFLGSALYLLVGRPRGGLPGVLATAPFVVLAVKVGYDADLLGSTAARTAAATAQGHHVAIVVVAAAVGAAVTRLALTPVDSALVRLPTMKRGHKAAAALGVTIIAVAAAVAVGVPGLASREYHQFAESDPAAGAGSTRARLASGGDNGRIGMWKIALRGYRSAKLAGHGAGTYEFRFMRERSNALFKVDDAHSLYVEQLDELGIVGLALVVVVLATMLCTLFARTRSRKDRSLYAAIFALLATWALHAAIDWDWEMPAITLWAFALGGVALARRPPAGEAGGPAPPDGGPPRPAPSAAAAARPPVAARLLVAAACAAIAILPVRLALADAHIGHAILAYQRGDCTGAAKEGRDATEIDTNAAQGYEVAGLCAGSAGAAEEGVRLLTDAVRTEPGNWHYHYALALVQGRAGDDPRPEARTAKELNPMEPATRAAVRAFATSHPAVWRVSAARLLEDATLAQGR